MVKGSQRPCERALCTVLVADKQIDKMLTLGVCRVAMVHGLFVCGVLATVGPREVL